MGAGSFYAAFDNKAQLFERVVDAYTSWSLEQFDGIREHSTGLQAISAFLERTLVDVSSAERHKGCLLVNSILELDGVEPALHQQVVTALGHLRPRLAACVNEARADGSLRPEFSAGEAVGLLMTLFQGLRVESRLGMTRQAAEQRIHAVLKILSLSPTQEEQRASRI